MQELSTIKQDNQDDDDKFAGQILRNQNINQKLKLSKIQQNNQDKSFFQIYFDFSDFKSSIIYKASVLEFIGSFLLCYIGECAIVGIVNEKGPPPDIVKIAVSTGISIVLLIFALGNTSGAHFNPLISFATWTTNMTTFPRMFVYIIAQLLGMLFASLLMKVTLGISNDQVITAPMIGGLSWGPNVKEGQAFLLEFIASLWVQIIAYGCAFDPNNGKIYGPIFAPILVAFGIGTAIFSTGQMFPMSTGAGMNPARAFGPAIAASDTKMLWVYMVAPFCSAIFHAFIYKSIPPQFYKKEEIQQQLQHDIELQKPADLKSKLM